MVSVTWPISCAACPSFLHLFGDGVRLAGSLIADRARFRGLAGMSSTVALICSVALATVERLP